MPVTSSFSYDQSLPTISTDGEVPSTRVTSAAEVRNLTLLWWNNDQQGRSQTRALTTGLIEGNPPFNRAKQIAAGRRDATNINWRTAEAYEESAMSPIYDLFSEAPTFATIDLDGTADFEGQDPERSTDWSQIVTEEFDYLLRDRDLSFDSVMQNSIRETTRFGAGPQVFPDDVDWRTRWIPFGNLLVPDNASSDINLWEAAAVLEDLMPHQLFDYIFDADAASSAGWNVDAARQAIIWAAPDIESANFTRSWEWVQQQLKQNSYSYSARSKVIQIIHFFACEFRRKGESKGKITHAIVLRSDQAGVDPDTFLFKKERRYDRWQQCIHPMYYAQGQGGKHYGVTGQGVKMYGPLELENRILCNMADKTFSPKILFKPTTASSKQRSLPQRMGDYMFMPEGHDLAQVSINSMIEEGLAMREVISRHLSSNLSSYRQALQEPKTGNPITKAEAEIRAGEQARLGKTNLNRYYEQLDWLYEEKYRRACNSKLTKADPGGEEALEFQEKCRKRGVPKAALLHYCSVRATRVIGQGSQYLRTQTLDFFLGLAGSLPESGRANVIKDSIAARAGQYMVERYYPQAEASQLASDQQAFATSQVADMKIGVPAVVTESQNPLIFASVFLQAGAQALESLARGGQQGPAALGAAQQVLGFLDLLGPAIAAHLQRMSQDMLRQGEIKALVEQFKRLGAAKDKLARQVEQAIRAQQQAQAQRMQKQMEAGRQALAIANGQDPALVVGLADTERKARIAERKAAAQIDLKSRKQVSDEALKARQQASDQALKALEVAQNMQLSDAETAAGIRRENMMATAKAQAAASRPKSQSK